MKTEKPTERVRHAARDPTATPESQASLRRLVAYSPCTATRPFPSFPRPAPPPQQHIESSNFSPLFLLPTSTSSLLSPGLAILINIGSRGLIFLRHRRPSTRTDIALVRGVRALQAFTISHTLTAVIAYCLPLAQRYLQVLLGPCLARPVARLEHTDQIYRPVTAPLCPVPISTSLTIQRRVRVASKAGARRG